MMESIEKLREYAKYNDVLTELAAAIEAELAERYVELPIDADGVPIHPGDKLIYCSDEIIEFGSGKSLGNVSGEMVVAYVAFSNGGTAIQSEEDWKEIPDFYSSHSDMNFKHRSRSLEDILKDMIIEADETYDERCGVISKYAAEICKLLGVDNG